MVKEHPFSELFKSFNIWVSRVVVYKVWDIKLVY